MCRETSHRVFVGSAVSAFSVGANKGNCSLLLSICAWAFLATSCTQPLGHGYRFAGRQAEIHFSGGAPEQFHVRVVDHFDDVGHLPLRSLDVRLPQGPNYGVQNIRVAVDGKKASPESDSIIDPRLMRIPLDPAWNDPSPHEAVTEWDMIPEVSTRGTVGASATAFYVADQTVLPLWQAPSGILTEGGPTPERETLAVTAPQDFRVLAPGKPLKPMPGGNLISRSFRIQPGKDFLPYIVAGGYQEQVVRTHQGAVRFWTLQALDAQQARTAAGRLSESMRSFADFFGPSAKGKRVVHVVEAPGDLPNEFEESSTAPGGTSFPEGVLLDSRAFAQGISSEGVLQLSEYELARTWFGWRVRPRPEAQILMGRGVGLFSLVLAAEARGQDQRERMVASLLARYDKARRVAGDRTLLEPPAGYSREERISTGYRAALLFVALEDLCGHEAMRTAFRNLIRAREEDDVDLKDVRSAMEFATGRNLYEMFHQWLSRSGVPEDFRARYAKDANASNAN